MKNVLIPFDFSKVSTNALEYAVKFASKDPSIQLFLLHITDGKTKEEDLRRQFDEIVATYSGPLNPDIKTLIHTGELIPSIIELQKKLKVDLVIMGTSGADGYDEDLATRTSKLIAQADLPVLVIPEKAKEFGFGTIILTVGKEKIVDRSPLHVLLDVSRTFNAKVHVLTVHKDKSESGYSEEDESNENTLQYFLENFYSHHSFSEHEDIEEGIREYMDKYSADMLAIMPRTHLKNGDASEGRLTKALALHSHKPLLVLD